MAVENLRAQWHNQLHPWERLSWARKYWQAQAGGVASTAEDAAQSMGMKPGTYRAYERAPGSSKHTPMGHQEAAKFGRKFRVSWTWLLTGAGTPFDDLLPEPQERVLRVMSSVSEEQQRALADMVEALLKKSVSG